jgi:hypothetical protein
MKDDSVYVVVIFVMEIRYKLQKKATRRSIDVVRSPKHPFGRALLTRRPPIERVRIDVEGCIREGDSYFGNEQPFRSTLFSTMLQTNI